MKKFQGRLLRAMVTILVCLVVLAVGRAAGRVFLSPSPVQTIQAQAPPSITSQPENTGVVYSIADGDTLTALDESGKKVRIRLLGIDAPEISHGSTPADCGGPEAKEALSAMVTEGDSVTWVTDPISDPVDVYGRVLAYISTADINDLGLMLLEQGRVEAWVPKGEPYPTRWGQYVSAQKTAQMAGEGSWSQCQTLGRD